MPIGKVTIGNITARYHGQVEEVAARRRLLHLLANSDVAPSGIAPQSILLVRSVVVPNPLPIALWRLAPDWERAAREVVVGSWRRATRPDRGWIPHNPEAVLFADEAEMLACLVRDIRRSEARSRWWWRTMLRSVPSMPVSSMLATLFCQHARVIPGVFGYLVAWGNADEMMQALTPMQAQEVFAVLCAAYGLAVQPRRETASSDAGADPRRRYSGKTLQPGNARSDQRAGGAHASPPWEAWIPHGAVPVRMKWERSCLLGVALALLRAPSLARSSEFGAALAEWREAQEDGKNTGDSRSETAAQDGEAAPLARSVGDPTLLPTPRHDSTSQPEEWTATPGIASETFRTLSEPTAASPAASDEETITIQHSALISSRRLEPATAEPPQPVKPGEALKTVKPELTPLAPDDAKPEVADTAIKSPDPAIAISASVAPGKPYITITSSAAPAHSEIVETVPIATAEASHQAILDRNADSGRDNIVRRSGMEVPGLTPAAFADGVATRLGGILYLINLMRHYDLPACFEPEWQLAGHIGAWGVLEALARGLLATESSPLEADPIWQALAMLNGREPGTRLGAALPASSRFHLPPAWLAESRAVYEGPHTIYWAAGRRTLRLWTEGGYLLVETPRNALSEEAQARTELAAYPDLAARAELALSPLRAAPIHLQRATLLRELAPSSARWLGRVLPFLRQRVLFAMNHVIGEHEQISALLHAPGRLYITATHVDLVMALDTISIRARMAGLDRDPGWMPDFGRVIMFHFR